MQKDEIVQKLRRLHTLLVLSRRSNNLALAIRRALESIDSWKDKADDILASSSPKSLFVGLGPKFVKIFEELMQKGCIKMADELQTDYDPFFCYLCEIPGIGVTMARRMFYDRSIKNMDDLRIAYSNNVLQKIPAFGDTRLKAIESILWQTQGQAGVEPMPTVTFRTQKTPVPHPLPAPTDKTKRMPQCVRIRQALELPFDDHETEEETEELKEIFERNWRIAQVFSDSSYKQPKKPPAQPDSARRPRIVQAKSEFALISPSLHTEKSHILTGYTDFMRLRAAGGVYIDKTDLIADIIHSGSPLMMFQRPAGFGKTLALSMLKCFFIRPCNPNASPFNAAPFFEGLNIMQSDSQILNKMGKYPVIDLCFGTSCTQDWLHEIVGMLSELFHTWYWLADSEMLTGIEKMWFESYVSGHTDMQEIVRSIRFLIQAVYRVTKKRPILLVDFNEDVLGTACHAHEQFPQMRTCRRDLLCRTISRACDENPALERAIVMSRSYVPLGKNFEYHTVRSHGDAEYFGFTEAEMQKLIIASGTSECLDEIQQWCGNYDICCDNIYHPESALRAAACTDLKQWRNLKLWSGRMTLGAETVLDIQTNASCRTALMRLWNGEKICQEICPTAGESEDWAMRLVYAGIVRVTVQEETPRGTLICQLEIPNANIKSMIGAAIQSFFLHEARCARYLAENKMDIYAALQSGQAERVSAKMRRFLTLFPIGFEESSALYRIIAGEAVSSAVGQTAEGGQGENEPDLAAADSRDHAYVFAFDILTQEDLCSLGLEQYAHGDDEILESDEVRIRDLMRQKAEGLAPRLSSAAISPVLKSLQVNASNVMKYAAIFFKQDCIFCVIE